jgi:hypothetical protein
MLVSPNREAGVKAAEIAATLARKLQKEGK